MRKKNLFLLMALVVMIVFTAGDIPAAEGVPNISANPTSKDFGSVTVGTVSSPQTFVISNTGTANLVIGEITKAGANKAEFGKQNDTCSNMTLAPSGTCTVDAKFGPISAGVKVADLRVPSNDTDSTPLYIPLNGTGVASADAPNISANPTSKDFGSVTVGTVSLPQTFVISNTGAANLVIDTITLTGGGKTEFIKQNDTCSNMTLAPSGTCTLQAEFGPISAGVKIADLAVPSNDPDAATLYIKLSGTGVVSPPGTYTLSLPRTGQTTSYATGDDGDLEKGVAWPSPRFTDLGDSTVKDNLTGLIWSKVANTPGPAACGTAGAKKTFTAALDWVACLNTNAYLGYTNWRLPNGLELESMVNPSASAGLSVWLNSNGFTNVQADWYWVSTTYAVQSNRAWVVNFSSATDETINYTGGSGGDNLSDGSTGPPGSPTSYVNKQTTYTNWVWPVRGTSDGISGTVALPKTGQTKCYNETAIGTEGQEGQHGKTINCGEGTGQDGDTAKPGGIAGVDWPSPRFTAATNTITDNLTGLMWLKDANCMGTNYSPYDDYTYDYNDGTGKGGVEWQTALDFVAAMNAGTKPLCSAGYTDWRLPNRKELLSLINMEIGNKATGAGAVPIGTNNFIGDWLKSQGFTNIDYGDTIKNPPYWTSTTREINTKTATTVDMGSGVVEFCFKTHASRPSGWTAICKSKYNTTDYVAPRVWPVRSAGIDLSVIVKPTGSGSVERDIQPPYSTDQVVTLTTVTPNNNGYAFSSWTGCDSPSGNVCTQTMDTSLESVTANFIPLAPSQTAVAFGTMNVGFNATRTIRVTNNSTVSAPAGSMPLSTNTEPSTPFSIQTDGCAGKILAPNGGNCEIIVKFTPTSTGTFSSTFSISGVKTIALTGTGVAAATGTVPDISVSDNVLNGLYNATTAPNGFLSVPDATDRTQPLTVYNNGNANLSISNISIIGTDAGQFSLDVNGGSNPCGSTTPTITGGGNCTVTVTYLAENIGGPYRATLVITSNDPDEGIINVGLVGSRLAAGNNNPPPKPENLTPANGATISLSQFSFHWDGDEKDSDGNTVEYRIYYSTDPSFSTYVLEPSKLIGANGADKDKDMYAKAFGGSMGILMLFGTVVVGGLSRKRGKTGFLAVFLIVTVIFAAGLFLNSCGGGGGTGVSYSSPSSPSELQSGTTYYWKVVANDGNGGVTESETYTFTTE